MDEGGQVIDVYLSRRRDLVAARRFFSATITAHAEPDEVITDLAPTLASVIEELARVVVYVDRSRAVPTVLAAAGELARRLDVGLVALEVAIPDVTGEPIGSESRLRSLTEGAGVPTTILVTGRRPADAPGRFVTGSVAVNLARNARGPVMVVPGPEDL